MTLCLPELSSNKRQALTKRHRFKTPSGGAACTVPLLNLFAGSVIEKNSDI